MRPIPPQIWSLAITMGRLLRAIDEVDSPHAQMALSMLKKPIDRFLAQERKGKRK